MTPTKIMKTYLDSISPPQNTENRLLTPFGISPLVKWTTFPGIVGLLMVASGFRLEIGWLKIVGLVLAAPLFSAYFLTIFVFMPIWLFDKFRGAKNTAR
jgi:hypothetical protein